MLKRRADWTGGQLFIYSLVLWQSLINIKTAASELPVSACFNQTDKSLSLTCSKGYWVNINKVIQGHSDIGLCNFREDDCIYEIKDANFPCVGRQRCDINLPSGDVGAIMHACQAHGNYMQIYYDCVKATEIADICERPLLIAQTGYISTPRYPNNYPNNQNCTLTIQTPFPSQKLYLYAIDLTLEGDSLAGCKDMLYMFDGHRSYTTCSILARESMTVTMENYLQLEFTSDSGNQKKGFWLYYEAKPYMTTTSPPPTNATTPMTTPQSSGYPPDIIIDPQIKSSTEGQDTHVIPDLGRAFPIGILIGVLIGLVLCILMVLLIILVLRRRHQKMSQSASNASSVAIMASKISKPIPPQTINNLNRENSLRKPQNYTGSFQKVDTHKGMNDVDIDMDYEKGPYKGAFIDRNKSTGQEQLFC